MHLKYFKMAIMLVLYPSINLCKADNINILPAGLYKTFPNLSNMDNSSGTNMVMFNMSLGSQLYLDTNSIPLRGNDSSSRQRGANPVHQSTPGNGFIIYANAAAGGGFNSNNNVITTKNLVDAMSNIQLNVLITSLAGSAYSFTEMNGTLTGGTLSNSNTTLTNATGNQTGTVSGLLTIPSGNYEGSYTAQLTDAVLSNATVTGTVAGTEFAGTNVTTGSISNGIFDIVFVQLPSGTVFTINGGDLGTTGTFTTTDLTYGLLVTGLSGSTQISNGQIVLIGSVNGTYNRFGTDYPGGEIIDVSFTGVQAVGTLSDVNHFQASGTPTGLFADPTLITIQVSLASLGVTGETIVEGGVYNGQMFTAISGINGLLSDGTLNDAGTEYDGALLTMLMNPCISGFVSGDTGYIIPAFDTIINNTDLSGVTVATINGLEFTADQLVTGQFVVGMTNDFVTGTFCS